MNLDKMRHQLARTAPSPLDQILAIIDRGIVPTVHLDQMIRDRLRTR